MTTTPRSAPCPASDQPALAALLRQVQGGDHAAFEALYAATSSRIYGVVVRVLRSRDLAAEVTQEVYVEVWQQAGRYSPDRGGVMAWMHTMAHRRAVDRVRSVSTAGVRDQRWAALSDVPHDEVWERASRRIEDQWVRAALSELTPLQRETVVAIYLRGLTSAEVAEQLGIPVSTVKTRLRNGLGRMRGALAAAA